MIKAGKVYISILNGNLHVFLYRSNIRDNMILLESKSVYKFGDDQGSV